MESHRKEEDKDGHVRFYDKQGYMTHEHCPNGPSCCGGPVKEEKESLILPEQKMVLPTTIGKKAAEES